RERELDSLSSGERKGKSRNRGACSSAWYDTQHEVTKECIRRSDLERSTKEGNSPVIENAFSPEWILSTAEHVKFRRNLGGPAPKAKYSLVTDSEPVP